MDNVNQLIQHQVEVKTAAPVQRIQDAIAKLARGETLDGKERDRFFPDQEALNVAFPWSQFTSATLASDVQARATYDATESQLDGTDAEYDAAERTRIEVTTEIKRVEEQLSALKSKRAIADHRCRAIAASRNALDRIRRQNPRVFWSAAELADEIAVRAAYGRI